VRTGGACLRGGKNGTWLYYLHGATASALRIQAASVLPFRRQRLSGRTPAALEEARKTTSVGAPLRFLRLPLLFSSVQTCASYVMMAAAEGMGDAVDKLLCPGLL